MTCILQVEIELNEPQITEQRITVLHWEFFDAYTVLLLITPVDTNPSGPRNVDTINDYFCKCEWQIRAHCVYKRFALLVARGEFLLLFQYFLERFSWFDLHISPWEYRNICFFIHCSNQTFPPICRFLLRNSRVEMKMFNWLSVQKVLTRRYWVITYSNININKIAK